MSRVNAEWAKFYAEGKSNHPVILDLALDLQDARAALNIGKALNDVLAERKRQRDGEGWSPAHDDRQTGFELTEAAVCYASHVGARAWIFNTEPDEYRAERPFPEDRTVFGHGDVTWPKGWSWDWWKPKNPRRDLVRAAALLIAEIERLDRAQPAKAPA